MDKNKTNLRLINALKEIEIADANILKSFLFQEETETDGYSEPKLEPDSFTHPEYEEFTVKNMGVRGAISDSNTIHLDLITLGHWREVFGEDSIKEAIITEPSRGKTARCKLQQTENAKYGHSGLVLVPEPLLRRLKIKNGSRILIKPFVEEWEDAIKSNADGTESENQVNRTHFCSDSPDCQLIAEDVSGFGALRGESDTVRFDETLIERWKEFYGESKIEQVCVENVMFGKAVVCKFKIVKSQKFEWTGLIQIPKMIMEQLNIKEGSIVTVRPVI